MISDKFLENLRKFFVDDIDIIENIKVSDKIGGAYDLPEVVNQLNGRIRPLKGEERQVAGKPTLLASHVLYCEYTDWIRQKHLIEWQGKKYKILFIQNLMEFDKMMQIYLEELK